MWLLHDDSCPAEDALAATPPRPKALTYLRCTQSHLILIQSKWCHFRYEALRRDAFFRGNSARGIIKLMRGTFASLKRSRIDKWPSLKRSATVYATSIGTSGGGWKQWRIVGDKYLQSSGEWRESNFSSQCLVWLGLWLKIVFEDEYGITRSNYFKLMTSFQTDDHILNCWPHLQKTQIWLIWVDDLILVNVNTS